MCTSAVFLAGEEVRSGYRLRLYSIFLMLGISIHLKSRRKKILSSEAHASVVYGWPRNLPEVRTVFQIQIHPVFPIVFSWATWFPLTSSPDWLPWILVVFGWKTALQSVGACLECPEASTFGKDRQSYAFMAGKPAPSSHESPGKWNQEPVTLIIGGGVGKSPIWCIQGWPLTDNDMARLVVNCLKFHSISCKIHLLELVLNSKLILFSFIAMFWCLAQPEKYQNSFFDVFLLSSHQTAYSPSCSEAD